MRHLLAFVLSIVAIPALARGPAELLLTACSGSDVTIEAIATALKAEDWQDVTSAEEAAFRSRMEEGLLLMQAERELSPATLGTVKDRMTRLASQLEAGVLKGTLPGFRMIHADGGVAMALLDPIEELPTIRCYYAGAEEARFTTLMDQMRDYHLLTYDQTYIERGPLDTTTNTTRTSTIISRVKPEAEALKLGETTQLALYVLTRRTKAG